MNGTCEKFKDKNKQSNRRTLFSFVARSCVCFWSSRIHRSISVESAIEKLHRVAKEKEAQKNEHKWR
jgi:hypothetical protein